MQVTNEREEEEFVLFFELAGLHSTYQVGDSDSSVYLSEAGSDSNDVTYGTHCTDVGLEP